MSTHKSNPSISMSPVSSSTINEAVGEGVIEDEDIFPLLRFSGAGISMRGLLLGTPVKVLNTSREITEVKCIKINLKYYAIFHP